jgi:nucleotidyltransferase substrate binding protein (TIGR01987 family)
MYLEQKIAQYKNAITNLEEVLKMDFDEIIRDSAIQRFEICYEIAWKAMKQTLLFKGSDAGNSPRDIFKNAFKLSLIRDENIWLDILVKRNLSTHTYSEELANSLYQKLPEFLSEMKYTLQKIQSETVI